jgi:sulfopropanediol 3-dehydrogenase
MENWLKRGKDESEVIAADGRVRETVEGILRDI